MQVNFIGLLNLLIASINIFLGILVLLKSKKLLINVIYALSVFTIAFWAISLYFYANPIVLDSTSWLKIVYISAYGMTLTQVLFTYFFPKRVKVKFWPFFFSILFFISIGTYLLITDQIIIETVTHVNRHDVDAILSRNYIFYAFSIIYAVIFILIYYFRKVKFLNAREREQMMYYVVGAVLMIIPVILFDFLFPLILKDTSFFKYSAISNLFFASIVAYSMLKKRFLGVRTIAGKMFLYLIVTLYNSIFVGLLLYVSVVLLSSRCNPFSNIGKYLLVS